MPSSPIPADGPTEEMVEAADKNLPVFLHVNPYSGGRERFIRVALTSALSASPLRERNQKLTEENERLSAEQFRGQYAEEALRELQSRIARWDIFSHTAGAWVESYVNEAVNRLSDLAALSPSYKGEQ